MQDFWWWWGLAVLFGVLEMVTATFYLLVLGVGLAVGGAVAFAGGGFAAQLVGAAVFSFVGWFLLRRYAPRREKVANQGNRDLLLDIGERVQVDRWRPGGRATVQYRGASWEVQMAPGGSSSPEPDEFVIRRIEGNRLIVGRAG